MTSCDVGYLLNIEGCCLREDISQRPTDSLKLGSSCFNSPSLLSAKLDPSKIYSSFPPT